MEEGLKLEIEKLTWHLVWIVSALEGVTVAILPYVARLQSDEPVSKPPQSGLLLGYVGMLVAVLLANALGTRTASLKIPGPFRIHNPFLVSVWGAVFLALIFLFQGLFDFQRSDTVGIMLRAACSLAASSLLVLFAYPWVVRWAPALAVRFTWSGASSRISRISIWPCAVFLAVYEALALPVIESVRAVEDYRPLAGLLLGLAAGAMATTIVIATYNVLSRMYPGGRLYLVVEPER